MDQFDLVIIGGGVGGLVTASGASQLGAKVALVEKESLGGDCLHWGCVPTKRLVQSAKAASLFKRSEEFGILGDYRVDFKKVMEKMRDVQARIGKNDAPERFQKMGVEVIFGAGHFLDSHTFEVNGRRLSGRKFLISTGSRPILLPIPGLKESGALTNVTALQLDHLPESIVILGAGPIGLEFAQVFARLGSKVTVIEKMGQILPREDKELADGLEKILKGEGIEIRTCTEVKEIQKNERGKKVVVAECSGEGVKHFETEEVMISIGRAPNVDGLNLKLAGVEYDEKKGIKVGPDMRTSQKHIFACGDVSGPYLFTHVAEYQAGIVVSNALFPLMNRKADYRVVPWVTYTDPELGRVGLTEEEAKKEYGEKNIQVFRFQFEEVDRAIIEGEGHGLIKLVCDQKNQILGAHLLGPNAGELLHEFVLAMKARIPITQISQTIHVYPTLSQAVKRVCDQYYRKKLFSGWFPKLAKRLIRFS